MRIYLLLFVLLLACISVNAQTAGKINGSCISEEKLPIEKVTVNLLRASDLSLIKVSLTDSKGHFEFNLIKEGKYLIKCESIGYKSFTSQSIDLSKEKSELTLDPFVLIIDSKSLNAISVTSKRQPIEIKIDKTVVNVDASPTNTGLTAMEVLEKSPGVSIDNNGNISLKGKQGVIILIDGKPSYLTGDDLTNYLKNLSANQLDQIEIMSQPSAKYDASGNSGIINIKTKKNRSLGFNGNISTSAIVAIYFKNTNSINLNWKKNKINLFGNYSYSYWEGFNDLELNRSSRSNANTTFDRYVTQHTYGRYSGRPQNYKAGIDYFASKNTTLGFVFTGGVEDDKFKSSSVAKIFDSVHQFVQYNNAESQTHNPWTNNGFNINFDHKFDSSGKELTADADYILYRTKGNQYSYNYLYGSDNVPSEDPFLLNGYLPANIDIFSFKSDYKQTLRNKATLEGGIKSSYVKTDNNALYTDYNTPNGKWESDTSRSNHFIYKENINAAYINYQQQINKWGIQLGLRAEQTIAKGNQITKQNSFDKNYTKLFPTAYITYKPNDDNTFGISYGRRIQRPGYQSLNPFQYQLDRYTYQQGNPNLQPQFSNNFELSYNFKGQLNISANYTTVSDIINDVLITLKQPGDSNYTTYQTSQNIASNRNIGLSANFNKQLKKWWTLNIFANVFNNYFSGVIDNELINISLTSFNANLSSQFTFNKGWSAEVSGWFNSAQLVASDILATPMGMFSIGGGKQILNKKGSLRLNVRDPFYLLSFHGSTNLAKGYTDIHAKWDNRRLIMTFTYRFGKTNQQERKRNSASDDERSRVNAGGGQQ